MQDKGAIEPVGRLVEQRDQLAPSTLQIAP
jgi:hypothetical protein